MKFFIVFALVAAAAAQVSNEYLPPNAAAESYGVEASAPSVSYSAPAAAVETYEVEAAAPAHSFSEADGYRYKTQRRRVVRRQRREVSNEYLPPVAVSESVPEVVYTAPTETYETAEVAPAHSFSDADGYRYKTLRRRVVRRQRRDVSNEYLPPVATTNVAPAVASYSAPVEASYSAPAAAFETYEVEAAAPAHSFSEADGYRYKTQRRRVVRRQRRDVSNEYLPPVAVSESVPEVINTAPTETYETAEVAPAHSFSDAEGYRYKTQRRRVIRRQRRDVSNEYLPPVAVSESVPEVVYTAPTETYETAEVAPAHSFSDAEGYRYKTQRRRVIRRQRRDVSNEYLPPVAAASYSAPAVSYSAPVEASYSAPVQASYSAPAAAVETYEVEAAAPAHSFSQADGYRYKTQRRRVIRRN